MSSLVSLGCYLTILLSNLDWDQGWKTEASLHHAYLIFLLGLYFFPNLISLCYTTVYLLTRSTCWSMYSCWLLHFLIFFMEQTQGIWQTKNQNMVELSETVKELKDQLMSFLISHVERVWITLATLFNYDLLAWKEFV